jgi:hypothetical protein
MLLRLPEPRGSNKFSDPCPRWAVPRGRENCAWDCPPDVAVSLALGAVISLAPGRCLKGCALLLRARRSDLALPRPSRGQGRESRNDTHRTDHTRSPARQSETPTAWPVDRKDADRAAAPRTSDSGGRTVWAYGRQTAAAEEGSDTKCIQMKRCIHTHP